MRKKINLLLILSILNISLLMSQQIKESLQVVLNSKEFKSVLREESNGKTFIPVILKVDDSDLTKLHLSSFNKKVNIIVNEEHTESMVPKKQIPLILEFYAVNDFFGKAKYIFFFNEKEMVVRLKKKKDSWYIKSFKTKNKSTNSLRWEF
ncbi:hypothetical protein [Tenacibaculum ovolyticum]|uniref:hypothetical protein n=1 Tax=Tenacibaculum ovolyticum TaxID=104270 RepID=UPI000419970B|nr:hypothetical protein [Tenacibaculum ovolyticum]